MYGYGNASQRYAAHAAAPYGHAYGQPHTGSMSIFGAEPTALDKVKTFMDKETMGVKNKYLLAGAAALGIGYYGYTKGWF